MNTIVVLPEKLDNAAVPLLGDLLEFCIGDDVWIDGTRVDFIGGRALEMLLSAARGSSSGTSRLHLTAASDALCESLSVLGLDPKDLFEMEDAQ